MNPTQKFCHSVWAICKRPGMYTVSSSLKEVLSVLCGMRNEDTEGVMLEFNNWLSCQNGSSEFNNLWWPKGLYEILELEDVSDFYSLFQEFLNVRYGYTETDYTIDLSGHSFYGAQVKDENDKI